MDAAAGIATEFVSANGIRLHYARAGRGAPLVLLHGWPEFWLVWQPVMERLAGRFDLIAPDLRGFGDTEKPDAGPSDAAGPDVHAADVLGLIDALGLARVGIACHDVGAYVAQSLARARPERCAGLFFFDCPYPGIGHRWAEAGHLIETWYQYFHQQPFAAGLVGASRGTCGTYVGHFLKHWSHRKDAFDHVLESWIDNFMKPGNLQGGFNWYVSSAAARRAVIEERLPAPAKIAVPACVRWGEHDPILPVRWADRLGEFFSDLDFAPMAGVGHFPHREDPDGAASAIAGFFERLGGRRPTA
jgi:pimeloyl-ACP methyl ester carboxylesterase